MKLFRPLHTIPLAELDYAKTRDFLNGLTRTYTARSVNNVWGTLRTILNEARREGLLTMVPEIQPPKSRKPIPAWFTLDQMKAIIAAGPPPFDAFYAVLAETGARIGEMLPLRRTDVDFSQRTIAFVHAIWNGRDQDQKNDSSPRTLCISTQLTDKLRPLVQDLDPGSVIFHTSTGRAWTPGKVLENLHPLLRSLGIKTAGCHAFRHGNRTLMRMLEVPYELAERRMGHALSGIAGVYSHSLPYEDKGWAQKIGDALF